MEVGDGKRTTLGKGEDLTVINHIGAKTLLFPGRLHLPPRFLWTSLAAATSSCPMFGSQKR
jgi:hypothetical protein